ncbi:MAG: hypothetical protein CMI54_04785 [Parcubacteria group bacterium]|nr:hypothetical protein [Parcubacteria group bacterium]|tara:strand:- start:33422 stop:33622 length:201 start_codon:yes stop_codon:yes gene_type:complete
MSKESDFYFFLKNLYWIAKHNFDGDMHQAGTAMLKNFRKRGEAKCDTYMKIEKVTEKTSRRVSQKV